MLQERTDETLQADGFLERLDVARVLQQFLILIMVCTLAAAVLAPMAEILLRSVSGRDGSFVGAANFREYFSNPYLFNSIYNTVYISFWSSAIAVVLALGYAYSLCRTAMRFKTVFKYIVFLPLFAPTMMHGIALMYLFGNQGFFTHMGFRIELYGPVGIIISEVLYTFPQAFLILLVSMSVSDMRLYEAAESLGAGGLRKFRTITLPEIRYGLVNSFIVCFILSFTDFGAPKVVGGNFNVLATDVYKQIVGQQNMSMGAVVGIVLLIPAVAAFVIQQILQKKHSGSITARSVPYRVKKNRVIDFSATLFCTAVSSGIIITMLAVLVASVVKVWPYNLSPTLDHYGFRYVAGNGFETYLNSVYVSALSAVIGTVVVFCFAYMIEKIRCFRFLRHLSHFLCILPLAVPGMVIGLGYIFFFNKPTFSIPLLGIEAANPFNGIYGTVWILVMANIVHFFSVSFITATTGLKKLDGEFELVSESMAVPFYRTFSMVTVPMSLPSILEIAMYYFVNSMVTISAVIFLYPADFKLASVAIVNMDDAGDIAPAAAMAVLLVITNIVFRCVYEMAMKKIKASTQKWTQNRED